MTDDQARMRARMLCDKLEEILRTAGYVTDGAVYQGVPQIAKALLKAHAEGLFPSLRKNG